MFNRFDKPSSIYKPMSKKAQKVLFYIVIALFIFIVAYLFSFYI